MFRDGPYLSVRELHMLITVQSARFRKLKPNQGHWAGGQAAAHPMQNKCNVHQQSWLVPNLHVWTVTRNQGRPIFMVLKLPIQFEKMLPSTYIFRNMRIYLKRVKCIIDFNIFFRGQLPFIINNDCFFEKSSKRTWEKVEIYMIYVSRGRGLICFWKTNMNILPSLYLVVAIFENINKQITVLLHNNHLLALKIFFIYRILVIDFFFFLTLCF